MRGYQAGRCNIGYRQRLRRSVVAALAFALAAALVAASILGWLPKPLLVVVFVPLTVGFEWGIQAYEAFCVRLAVFGEYDFRSQSDGTRGVVPDPESREADRSHAVTITLTAIGAAAVATALLVAVV